MGEAAYVSRLRWDRALGPGDIEVPHAFGQPVDIDLRPGSAHIREWPNRLGVLERSSASDTVNWHRDLAPRPPDVGRVVPRGDDPGPDVLDERLRWLRRLLKRFEQAPGVTAYVQPDAPCAILLTPGIAQSPVAELDAEFGGAVESLADVLPEFPGGLQLRVTDLGWERKREYAESIEGLLREDR